MASRYPSRTAHFPPSYILVLQSSPTFSGHTWLVGLSRLDGMLPALPRMATAMTPSFPLSLSVVIAVESRLDPCHLLRSITIMYSQWQAVVPRESSVLSSQVL